MNTKLSIIELDVLKTLNSQEGATQREIAEMNGASLGSVNGAIVKLRELGYISAENTLTDEAKELLKGTKPQNAVILAAGFGMRMVPINTVYPKAMLKVHGEVLIERLIRQLHEAGITKIDVVVGFMKESFEYLIDEYGVNLITNRDYASKENLHSLKLASAQLGNTYVIPSDIWFRENPFAECEPYSWYMVAESKNAHSRVKLNRNKELIDIGNSTNKKLKMMGVAYISNRDADEVRIRIAKFSHQDDCYWEDALYTESRPRKMMLLAKKVPENFAVGINTYDQLCTFDSGSESLQSDAIDILAKVFDVDTSEITNIEVLKKGMTNRSFLFRCKGEKYIMRIPGEGTERLINREHEYQVYEAIKDKGISDDIIYFDVKNGYKVTKFLENTRNCDPEDWEEVAKCMKVLRKFHSLDLKVEHDFDIFGEIELYEKLWGENKSIYRDYTKTKQKIYKLKQFIDSLNPHRCLAHIDAVPDNFLFCNHGGGEDDIRIIDWEYAGMQDPHVDLAMFSLYSMYSKDEIDKLNNIYFDGACNDENRAKIYAYISICGLLWSNWCEYKRQLGVEFGEYSLKQYRYAKEYYKYASELIESL